MLSNELSEIGAGWLSIISGGFGPQCTIEGLLTATRHRGPSALVYGSSGVNQAAGTVGACCQICWGQFEGRDIGFLVGGAHVHSVSLIALMIGVVTYVHTYFHCHQYSIICILSDIPYIFAWLSIHDHHDCKSTDPLGPSFKAVTRVWCQLILNTILWVQWTVANGSFYFWIHEPGCDWQTTWQSLPTLIPSISSWAHIIPC